MHVVLVGTSGVGKTCAACTWPGKTIVLDFDDRIKGILGVPFLEEKIKKGEIEFETIVASRGNSYTTIKDIYTILEKIDIRVGKKEIENVIVDSTSSMVRFFINESLNSGKLGIKHHNIGDLSIAQKQDYNYCATAMSNIIYDNLKTFRCNVFLNSHYKDRVIFAPTDADPERTLVVGQKLKAPGQLSEEIPSWFDETWELQIDATIKSQLPRRTVYFKGEIAKSCIPGIPQKLDYTGKSLYDEVRKILKKEDTEEKGK